MKLTILWIGLICILSAVLRIIGLDKTGGLWNDEYISWYISYIPFGKSFVDNIFAQCHMPFYYLYLKFLMLFGQSDFYLRMTSVIPNILAIPVMYMVGREKSRMTGFLCALFASVSAFLIYFSQEVRFYSILFLFSALSLYFTLRIIKKANIKNTIGFILFNLLVIFTHTIGFVYVFFDLLFVSIKLFKLHKKIILSCCIFIFAGCCAILPLIIKIFTTISFSQWWANFSIQRIIQVFIDYFTPLIFNITPIETFSGYKEYSALVVIAFLIAITFLLTGFIKKNCREINQVGYIALFTFLVILTASYMGKLVLETKYTIEIYPILIFVLFSTITSFSKKRIKIPVLLIFFAIQIYFIFTPEFSAIAPREEGHKYPAQLLQKAKLKKNDFIVLTYYPKNRFGRYINFDKYNVVEIHKGNFNEYYTPKLSYKDAVKQGKDKYKSTFFEATLPVGYFKGSKLIYYINDNVYKKMKKGQRVAFLFLDSVSFLDETTFSSIVTDKNNYFRTPLLYLVFSDIRNEIIKTMPKNARNIRYEVLGAWTVVSFSY